MRKYGVNEIRKMLGQGHRMPESGPRVSIQTDVISLGPGEEHRIGKT